MSKIYPYLDKVRISNEINKAKELIDKYGLNNYNPKLREQFQDEMMEWYQFGVHVTKKELIELRKNIISMAENEGFPDRKPSDKSVGTAFDRKLAVYLYESIDITPSIAANIEMWAYLNIILIPDVVMWRWGQNGDINADRFASPTRNYLGSLWWSYIIYKYDSDNTDKYDTITADQFVGFFERTNSRGLPNYIHKFVFFLEEQAHKDHKKVDNDVIREMNKLLKIEFAYRDYMCLSEDEIEVLLVSSYEKALDIVAKNNEQELASLSKKKRVIVVRKKTSI